MADSQEIANFGDVRCSASTRRSPPRPTGRRPAAKLKDQRDDGIVRKYYDQNYIDAARKGDIWITMAWSGDVFQKNLSEEPDLKFVIPEEGGTIWTDNLMIPMTARQPGRRDHADGLPLRARRSRPSWLSTSTT